MGSLSWSGTWTFKHKLENSRHGSEVYGGQGSKALTKLPLGWLDWGCAHSYSRSTILINVEVIGVSKQEVQKTTMVGLELIVR